MTEAKDPAACSYRDINGSQNVLYRVTVLRYFRCRRRRCRPLHHACQEWEQNVQSRMRRATNQEQEPYSSNQDRCTQVHATISTNNAFDQCRTNLSTQRIQYDTCDNSDSAHRVWQLCDEASPLST